MPKYFSRRKVCNFCQANLSIDWKDIQTLRQYVSERGKIFSRSKTGTCAYHQRRLIQAIKRARHMALLPFVTR